MSYQKHVPGRSNAPVTTKMRTDQVQASDGGYVFQVDEWGRLERFLILGTIGGSYYASERELSRDAVLNTVLPLIRADGQRVLDIVRDISVSGRAIKNTEALFILALCSAEGDEKTRRAAFEILPEVARTGTHLFQFVNFAQEYRGWGLAMKRGISNWYTSKDDQKLAYQMLKYRNRHGFTQADLVNLAHPVPQTDGQNVLFSHAIASQYPDADQIQENFRNVLSTASETPRLLRGFMLAQEATDVAQVVNLIGEYGLTREMIPTQFLNDPAVWEAFLADGMPMTAMVRNLGNMSRYGLIQPLSDSERIVLEQLGNEEAIKGSRIHPLQLLVAMLTYKSGRGFRGSGTWNINPKIVDALDSAFYASFENVEPTGKRIMIALDVSASMTWDTIAGVPGVTPRAASAVMSMITARTESAYQIVAFSNGVTPLALSPRQRLDDVITTIEDQWPSSTDVSAPIVQALKSKTEVDAFIVYTDNETNCGVHPYKALQKYRDKMGIPAKLIVVGMIANGFTVADPHDPGMLDVVGFDTAAPRAISEFIRG